MWFFHWDPEGPGARYTSKHYFFYSNTLFSNFLTLWPRTILIFAGSFCLWRVKTKSFSRKILFTSKFLFWTKFWFWLSIVGLFFFNKRSMLRSWSGRFGKATIVEPKKVANLKNVLKIFSRQDKNKNLSRIPLKCLISVLALLELPRLFIQTLNRCIIPFPPIWENEKFSLPPSSNLYFHL